MDEPFAPFADPWEHVRLLSDPARNDMLLRLLRRHAPGRRVLEVGCGTGLFACVAARMGASRVYAVEPTPMVERARELVDANGLADVVEVIEGRIQDVEPRPVDLAFAEMLNANPFLEEPAECADAAARWLVPGGVLAPHRLRVWVALARCLDAIDERDEMLAELGRLQAAYDLDLRGTVRTLQKGSGWTYVSRGERPISSSALAHDLTLGVGQRPAAAREVHVVASHDGPVGGALVWFQAELDDGHHLGNVPPDGGHWGTLACPWAAPFQARAGQRIALSVRVVDHEITVTPAARPGLDDEPSALEDTGDRRCGA